MRAHLERKTDGCREYFVRKDRSVGLRTDQADPRKRLLGRVCPAYGGEPCRPRAIDARCRGENPRHGGHLSHGAGRWKSAVAFPQARDRRKLRRRLRPRRFSLCARAQHRHHQYARRADRRGRRRRHGASDLDLARIRQGRPLSALRPVADAELPPERRLAARPQDRHRRHGPDRAGDRTPARGLARAGFLPFAQAVHGRLLPALSRFDGDGEGGGYADRDRAGRRHHREDDQCRRAEGARSARRADQRGARLRRRRAGFGRGAEGRHHSGGGARRVRQRADRAGRTEIDAKCRAVATYRLGFGGNAQRHGSARRRQPQELVCRQGAPDARCGNPGEGTLMSSLRSCMALTALLVLASPARAQDASTLKKEMIGQWELATTERSKTCVVTLKEDTTAQGLKLELEPGCAKALPFTKDITAWNIKGLDIVRMQDAAGQPVIDFTEVESGIFEGLRTGEGVYILQNLAAARSLAKSMDQMIGDWSM